MRIKQCSDLYLCYSAVSKSHNSFLVGSPGELLLRNDFHEELTGTRPTYRLLAVGSTPGRKTTYRRRGVWPGATTRPDRARGAMTYGYFPNSGFTARGERPSRQNPHDWMVWHFTHIDNLPSIADQPAAALDRLLTPQEVRIE